ncbi:MAG TPA: selenide, water dikinase SelD [Dongiaceae bacterium]|nr:selenide, water dikinase SelD [Dongiaceae bacterium]
MNRDLDIRTDIVLLGGGHAHVHVLKAFAMRPEPRVRLTLVTRDLETPYSGMLPGMVAGLYTEDEAHIDLVRLAAVTGTRLIHADAIGLDRQNKRVTLRDRPPIAYDLLSIDVGITPALDHISGAAEHGIAVKPIGSFLAKFSALRERCRASDGPRRIVVIGGGAGGVELLLSVRTHLLADARKDGRDAGRFSFALVTEAEILPTHNARVRDAFRRAFAARGMELHEHHCARAVTADAIELEAGATLPADAVLVTTGAAAPGWFRDTGLALDKKGFLAVAPTLQVLNDPDVFGAGDCVTLTETPREKAGVFAVRAGRPLAGNLRRRARGEAMKSWRPQRRHLALISTGERYAVASRGGFKLEGAWVWSWKDWIDRRWMRMYQDSEAMLARMPRSRPEAQTVEEMRCGGCAAKVGPEPLSQALARLGPPLSDGVVLGLSAPDDAAVIDPPRAGYLVQTVDFFRAFISDPFVFGEIAANHALNDIFAMGAVPRHALATAVVPAGPAPKAEETLFQLLSGARACLDREGVALVGGHSSEGVELALGFSVTGEVRADQVLRKGGLKAGDALVLTRPLGTGILFAAAMRGRAPAAAVAAAIAEMRRSNRQASEVLRAHGATAMTDVTGFGLIGHLGEMLAASQVDAELDLSALPLYDGAAMLARAGIASTLLPDNLALLRLLRSDLDGPTKAILFDPQTSGGLLAGIPAQAATGCVAALRSAGHTCAAIIGRSTKMEVGSTAPSILVIGNLGPMVGATR